MNSASQEQLTAALYEIGLHLPEETMQVLAHQHPSIMNAVTSAGRDNNWWFRKTEYLVGKDLTMYKPTGTDSWGQVYRSIEEHGARMNPHHDWTSLLLVRTLMDIVPEFSSSALVERVIERGTTEVLQFLLSDPHVDMAEVLLDEPDLIASACSVQNRDMVLLLLRDGRFDPAISRNEAFLKCVALGDLDLVQLLMSDRRVDLAARKNSAVSTCCKRGYTDILTILLRDRRVLHEFSEEGNDDIHLQQAIAHCRTEIVRLILLTGRVGIYTARSNFTDACRYSTFEICEMLLAHFTIEGLNVPRSAITAAETRGRADVLKLIRDSQQA
ncbi:Hypothetical protein POVR2_LOCUS340 [uncultured virus]|nr:Hypothetical protein POVR2_LOCUS340 [uncultured virus]